MLKDRISTTIEEKNIRIKDFATAIGVTANYISMLKSGAKTNLGLKTARVIEQKFGYSKDWILDGTPPKLIYSDLSKLKQQFIAELANYSENEIAAMLAFSRTLGQVTSLLSDNAPLQISALTNPDTALIHNLSLPENKYSVPLKGVVAAGNPIIAVPSYETIITQNPKADFAVMIKGDSMEPMIKQAEVVFCKETPVLNDGDIGIFQILGDTDLAEVVCKTYHFLDNQVKLSSINKKYNDLSYDHDQVQILGKVLI